MCLAKALTVSLNLAAHFAFPMSKVWLLNPYTFVTNSCLIAGPAALMDLRKFLAPSFLGVVSNIFSLSFWSV